MTLTCTCTNIIFTVVWIIYPMTYIEDSPNIYWIDNDKHIYNDGENITLASHICKLQRFKECRALPVEETDGVVIVTGCLLNIQFEFNSVRKLLKQIVPPLLFIYVMHI